MARIAVIPGDGIGAEVAREGLKALVAVNEALGLGLSFDHFDYGADRYLRDGTTLPEWQIEEFRKGYQAILFGAVGDPRIPDGRHAREILLALRFKLDLYINFRPCRPLADRFSPLKGKGQKELDFVVFRENTEGQYSGAGGVLKQGTADEVALSEEIHTRKGVERIIRAAFAWAKENGKKRVCMADKANAIPAHELWRRCFKEVSAQYPGIQAKAMYVDALAMAMVQSSEQLDVIVTNNLYGDILTDLGAALTGGLGLAASGNIHPGSISLFEPVHGSAPDIAGKGLANPVAMVLTGALMLRHLGFEAGAKALEQAVDDAVAQNKLTRDVGGELATGQVGDFIAAKAADRARALAGKGR